MRKRRTLITLASMILLLSIVTLAYYTGGLSNDNAQTASLSTGTMELTFSDGDNGIAAAITFGGTITKKFTLTNTGTLDASASISWFNLVNTYLDGSLMYSLEYSETLDGEYEPIVSNLMVPTSDTAITTPLVTQVTVPAKKAEDGTYIDNTYYYNLHITLVNSPIIDQTADINASLNTQFTISDASNLSASEQTLANLGLVVSNKTADFTKIAGTIYVDNWFSSEEKTYNVPSSYVNSTIYYSNTYTLDESTGLYSLGTLKSGVYKDIINNLNNEENIYISGYSSTSWRSSYYTTNIKAIYKITSASYDSITNTGSWNYLESYNTLPDYSTTGIYSMEDNYGTSYYFRGAPENNYVKFGKYKEDMYLFLDYHTSTVRLGTLSECQNKSYQSEIDCTETYKIVNSGDDIYWRIVRINGDGSLRVVYEGTKAYKNGATRDIICFAEYCEDTECWCEGFEYTGNFISFSIYNKNLTNDQVGYMYGLELESEDTTKRCLKLVDGIVADVISTYTTKSACEEANGKWTTNAYEATHANVKDSTIKSAIDSWYKTNIYDKGYSSAISDTLFCNDRSISSGTGIRFDSTHYKAYERLYTNNKPQLTCTQQNDRFTVNDTTVGNGDLTYPIGLLSADEMVLAGAKDDENNKMFYLNKGEVYWSLSPVNRAVLFELFDRGNLYASAIGHEADGVVPVLNLTPEYVSQMIGDGTIGNEFRVE